jgi:hypothetical protein
MTEEPPGPDPNPTFCKLLKSPLSSVGLLCCSANLMTSSAPTSSSHVSRYQPAPPLERSWSAKGREKLSMIP